jgi:dTDP-4-amino-4,6-dideoxygalactose transaminase
VRHALHLFTMRIDPERCRVSRDTFLAEMTQRRIGVGVHYLALAEHPYYQRTMGWRPDDYPHATVYGRETVSLPLSPGLSEKDVRDVLGAVREIVS